MTGAEGQLGRSLCALAPARGVNALGLSHAELDICDAEGIERALERHRPQVVVNAAAYTRVDDCERASEQPRVWQVNAEAPGALARACAGRALLTHPRTDSAFAGRGSGQIAEHDPCEPLSCYGRSKLAGERAVRAAGGEHLIVRTQWLFGPGPCFVRAILRRARSGEALRVVCDEIGRPTWTGTLSRALLDVAARPERGTIHVANQGITDRHAFACAIVREGAQRGWNSELPVERITGGAGFIGSHLCRRFLNEGLEVVCMDNLLTGRLSNVDDLFGRAGFSFVKHDVTSYIHVPGTLDAVLHFASPASPADFERLPIEILKVGALGTHKALGVAKQHGARFLLASTSECYGDPEVNPQPETYWGNVNPIGIRGVYDEAKRFGEAMTMAYHRYHGVDTRIVRIFNTYGPGMRPDDGRMIPTFFSQALLGEELSVFGDGSQTRSINFVSDLIEGICRLLHSDYNEPINLGNPEELTVVEVAERILALTGSKSQLRFCELPPDDPKVRRPDISRAREVLGWDPLVSPDDGLRRTLPYFEKEVKQPVA